MKSRDGRSAGILFVLPIDFGRGVGTTRNVSVRGVFFDTETALEVGDTVRFRLKDIGGQTAEGVEVLCEGRVVRLERTGGSRIGVAVAIDNIVLGRDLPQSQASSSLELE